MATTHLEMVAEFHARMGFATDRPWPLRYGEHSGLPMMRDMLKWFAEMYYTDCVSLVLASQDHKGLMEPCLMRTRLHLIFEELSELLSAIIENDVRGVLDAAADLEYVLLGIGVAYSLPMDMAFEEVQRSNMTKSPATASFRAKVKGPDYSPPNFDECMRVWQENRNLVKETSHVDS